jgi:hypothetical protein
MEAGRDDDVDHFERPFARDRHVTEELARARIRHDGALVTDHRVVDARFVDVRADGPEHPARHDDDVHAGGARSGDGGLRPRAQDGVLGDQRSVEVDREGGERPGEAGGKLYGSVPPVDFTT